MNARTANAAKVRFVRIKYKLSHKDGTPEVEGFAFETPGWPEFRACVRWGSRYGVDDDDIFNNWIVDHYDTGLAVSLDRLSHREDAPAALAKRLEEVGREKVLAALQRHGR